MERLSRLRPALKDFVLLDSAASRTLGFSFHSNPKRPIQHIGRLNPTLGNKGQAAITDALYFMLIVTGLCVFLFGFANTYGVNANQQIQSNYHSDFATDSLKTILYSSLPRNVSQSLYDPAATAEIDYLLAYIKEDYADDQNLTMEARTVLANNIRRILSPIKDNFDYMFIIRLPPPSEKKEFIYIYMKKTNFTDISQPGERFPKFFPVEDTDQDQLNNPDDNSPGTKDASVTYYLCGLGRNSVKYEDLDRAILVDIMRVVGTTNQASSKILLARSSESGFQAVNDEGATASSAFPDFRAQTDLILWNSTPLKDINDPTTFAKAPWCCVEIEDFKITPGTDSLDNTCLQNQS